MNMKYVRELVINITDICNMECEFCMRGDSGGRKLDLSLLPKIFDGIDVIDCLTITGGDPSCNVEAVTAIVDYLVRKQDGIRVDGMFIATNAKEYRQELVDAVKAMLFLYLEKAYGADITAAGKQSIAKEITYKFNIAVSMDQYHEPISFTNYIKYRTSGVYSDSKEYVVSKGRVIARGRGSGIYGSREIPYREFKVEVIDGNIETDEVYVTVEGKVFADCDMSYEMEEYNEPAGDLYEESLAEIMQRYAEESK